MAKKTKLCTVTGVHFPVTEFYENKNTQDGLHPYSKYADDYRRSTEFSTTQLRRVFTKFRNLLTTNK